MKTRTVLRSLAMFALAGMLCVPAAASAKDVLRFANTGGPNDDYTFGCQKFVDNMKELSKGGVEVKLMNNGVLGNDRVACEMTQQGSLDFALVGQSQFNLFVKPILAMDLPYMVKYENNRKVLEAFTEGKPLYQYVDKEAAKAGLKLLMVLDTPFRSYAFSPKANVSNLDSLKGLKARVTMSPIEKSFVNAIGMNPCPLGWTEVYTALQQGTVDGEIINLGTFASCNRAEVENSFYLTRHNMAKVFVVMNKKKFDAYSPDMQKMILQAADSAMRAEWDKSAEFDKLGEKYCAEHNIKLIEMTDAEKAKVQELVKPIYDEYKDKLDPEFVKLLGDAQK